MQTLVFQSALVKTILRSGGSVQCMTRRCKRSSATLLCRSYCSRCRVNPKHSES